jgi:outer membrane receptor protein involved in Fe transport
MNETLLVRRLAQVCGSLLVSCCILCAPRVALAQDHDAATAASLGDGVDKAGLTQTADLTAAEASQRLLGATVVDGQSVYVRGMGTRYTNALLNGAPLPDADTDRKTIPLDLFPALALGRLTITRQFLPDTPADFAGGLVHVDTLLFPEKPLFQFSLSGAFDTASTGNKRVGYDGSSTDWLGFDSGRRSLPSGLPIHKLDAASTTTTEQVEYGHRFNTPLVTFMKATPPNFGVKLVTGNTYRIAPEVNFGVMMALIYDRSYRVEQLTQRMFRPGALPDGSNALLVAQDYAGQRGVDSVRWGALGSAALCISKRHVLSLVGFHGQEGEDTTSDLQSPGASSIHATHLEYVSRALDALQLRGEHHFPQLSDLEIDWQATLGNATRKQPDTRDVRYQLGARDGIPGWNFISDSSGEHQFLDQSDTSVTAGFDVLAPLIRTKEHETRLKMGALVMSRDTDFRARRFQLVPARTPGFLFNELSFCPGATFSGGCANYLFRPDLIRTDGLLLNEWTLNHDQYQTGLDVYAVYGMVDTQLLPRLHAVAGARVEITFQDFSSFDPANRADTELRSQIYRTDWLPAASLIYELAAKSDVRFGISQTLMRPRPNELSPAPSTSFAGEATVLGNPELGVTKITNLDLRFEAFPNLGELLAAGVFFKHLRDPIEELSVGSGVVSYTNAARADVLGAELEARKSLSELAAQLHDFSIVANLTLTQSAVVLGSRSPTVTRDTQRSLAYQSPYALKLVLEYANQQHGLDIRLLYSVYGAQDIVVGTNRLPDEYELARNSLDLSASKRFGRHFAVKLQAQNILNAPIVFAYRGQQGYRQTDALTYQSLGREPETQRFNPGTILAATATFSY